MKKLIVFVVCILAVTGCSENNVNTDKENNNINNEQPKEVICEDGFYNRDNECVSTEGVINLNDNIEVSETMDYYSAVTKKCADIIGPENMFYVSHMFPSQYAKYNIENWVDCLVDTIDNKTLEQVAARPWFKLSTNKEDLEIAEELRLPNFSRRPQVALIVHLDRESEKYDSFNGVDILLKEYQLSTGAIAFTIPREVRERNVRKKTLVIGENEDYYYGSNGEVIYTERGKARKNDPAYIHYFILDEKACNDYNLTCGRW